MNKRYQQDINFLESLTNIPKTTYMLGPKDKKIFIHRLKNFLSLVGNPQNNLKFIHVAGTSGKGSTVKILESLIKDANLKVGAFTSPFATTSIERIGINNKLIPPKELHKIIKKYIKPALDSYVLKFSDSISYFEAWLAIALIYFDKQKCDWAILEAGMGGTHDATNIINQTKIAAITNIGLDHTHILGNTKEKIAEDKAGIIKENSIFLTSEKNKKILKIFEKTCRQKKAWLIKNQNLVKEYKNSKYFSTDRQKQNLNLALNILDVLKIKPKNPKKIIENFSLICRQEIIQDKPLVILDGSHNKDKLNNLIEFVKKQKYQKLHSILGFGFEKNYNSALKKLLNMSDRVYLTRYLALNKKTAELKKLYSFSKKINPKLPISVHHDPYQALDLALKSTTEGQIKSRLRKNNDLILITGSFFLAGELRKKWVSENYILKNLKLDKRSQTQK